MTDDLVRRLSDMNATSPFNLWAGFTVATAEVGHVELRMPWRAEFAEYRGVLSAAIVQGFLETACGFAASTTRSTDGASHCAVSFISPAAGEAFVARATVVKSGRRQIFITGELFADQPDGGERLIATATQLMISTPT